jgi:hypothetical protein
VEPQLHMRMFATAQNGRRENCRDIAAELRLCDGRGASCKMVPICIQARQKSGDEQLAVDIGIAHFRGLQSATCLGPDVGFRYRRAPRTCACHGSGGH